MTATAAHPVFMSLTPVFLLIALGVLAGKRGWIRPEAVKDLSNLTFMLLIPALLFRTMSQVHLEQLDLRPIGAYFPAVFVLFALIAGGLGLSARSVVMALTAVFSNMVMIGITLVELAYGQAGLVTLLTLVSVHALLLLTTATVVLELASASATGDDVGGVAGGNPQGRWRRVGGTAARALKGAVLHPVPLPIVCGLLFAQTGWSLPLVVDRPLALLGGAFGPVSLVLVGATMAHTQVGAHWRPALALSLCKTLLLPALVGMGAWLMGIRGLPLTVMVVAAGMPVGANVFLFSQRYGVAHDQVTASLGLSTLLAPFTLSALMLLMA